MELNSGTPENRAMNTVSNFLDERMNLYSNKKVDYTGIVKKNCEFWDFIHYYDSTRGKSTAKKNIYEINNWDFTINEDSYVMNVNVTETFVYGEDEIGYGGNKYIFSIEKFGDEYLITDMQTGDKEYNAE